MGDISKDINSTFPSERVKALINIKYTANWLNCVVNRVLKPHNITEQQYNILRILRGAGKRITVNTIKELMVEKSPNATRLMDKLCDKKLIERTRCDNDRRIVYIKISTKGLKLLDGIDMKKFVNPLDKITKEEVSFLNKILNKIR